MVSKIQVVPGDRQRTLAGFGYGLHQPILFFGFGLTRDRHFDLAALNRGIGFEAEVEVATGDTVSAEAFSHWLLDAIHHIHLKARLGALEKGKLVRVQELNDGSARCLLVLPYLNSVVTRKVIDWLLDVLSILADSEDSAAQSKNAQRVETRFQRFKIDLEKYGIRGVNMTRILPAALDFGVPFKRLENDYYIFGYGRYQRILNSTITDSTSSIGVSLARNKLATANLLKMAGLPTTTQVVVADREAAVRHAATMGYPVVIKPVDADGGKGVYAGLSDEKALLQAFNLAAKLKRPLLLEKHVEGFDYRINISHGKVIKAIQRIPGGVHGDGVHSVAELVTLEQNRPWALQRARERGKTLLTLDEEALSMLSEAGLSSESVLEAGVFQPLRQRANISSGGTMVDVSPVVHPDNSALALRAAQTINLDLAGIDLLMPDIGVSWREGGAVICEVNAQPQLSAELAPDIFRQLFADLFPNGCRSRLLVILCDEGARSDAQAIAAEAVELLAQAGDVVSCIEDDLMVAGSDRLPLQSRSFIERAQVALYNKGACATVLVVSDEELVRFGLPAAYGDCLFVTPLADPSPPARNLRRAALEVSAPHFQIGVACDVVASGLAALPQGCKSTVEVSNLQENGLSVAHALVELVGSRPLEPRGEHASDSVRE